MAKTYLSSDFKLNGNIKVRVILRLMAKSRVRLLVILSLFWRLEVSKDQLQELRYQLMEKQMA